ncbi:MAG: zf-HC2 domain-containing protein [Spirochaetales bacterium]|nr:zf-HC2 domain-containing protein [Spirochaetales bacterium]
MCLDDQILNTYLDGELTEPWKSQVEEHLSYCSSCRTRYQNLLSIKGAMKNAELSDEEIQPRMDRVLSMIEKNYLSKNKKQSFLRRTFKLTAPQLLGVAAAFVVVFVGSWAVFGGKGNSNNAIPLPDVSTSIDATNITPTRSSDNSTTSKSLENYSLDEILKNLDARGYDVELKIKSIQPLKLDNASEVHEIAKVKGTEYVITSDGVIKKADGTTYMVGVRLDEQNRIVTSDGTVLYEADALEILPVEN